MRTIITKTHTFVAAPLISGSIIMILGSNFGNFMSYAYHIVLGRILGPSQYSELTSFISLLGLLSIGFTFLGLVIVKFAAKQSTEQLADTYSYFMRIANKASIICFVALLVILPLASYLLRIHIWVLFIIIPVFMFNLRNLVMRSFLQAQLKFTLEVATNITDNMTKFLVSVFFVVAGFGVFGAVGGFLAASIMSFLLLRKFSQSFSTTHKKNIVLNITRREIITFAIPAAVNSFAILSFFSIDMLFVRHYFLPTESGTYAAVSTLGKILFFAAGPINGVMFPVIAKKFSNKENYLVPVYISLVMVISISVLILLLFLLFPETAISTLYGSRYSGAADLLFYYGLFIMLLSISSLIANFFLSIEKPKPVIFVVVAAIAQLIGIFIFHSSLLSVIYVSIWSSFILCIVLLLQLNNEKTAFR